MKIRVVKPFWHEDKPYRNGDVIDVPDTSGEWLIQQKAAEEVITKPKPKKQFDAKENPD